MDSDMDDIVISSSEDAAVRELKKMAKDFKGRGSDRNHGAFEEDGNGAVQKQITREEQACFVPCPSVDGWLIFVRNLSEEITEQDLKDRFIDYGRIKNINLHINRMTGYPMGTAIIEYEKFKEASDAISAVNGKTWINSKLEVGWCFMKPEKKS
ncbi:RRM 1 domain containing protein [Trichuris trichiura]|uniref:RNA-binding protein 8A n=1 Tax=Trichuris trichiura TaxID=36087 RepID=A0A077ZD19_TRITR|nr:RRM 1 domain containing protein [Trichuris trichiura]